jgi:formylglycine-generating enzyme
MGPRGRIQWTAHLEGSGQGGKAHRALSFYSWGRISDDDGSRRRVGHVTESHSGCLRQSRRLRSVPHQSPIRIKAWERALTERHSVPCLWAMLLAALLVTIMAWPAAAAEGKRVAFVVGIGTYDNLPAHQQLKNAVNDADGVSKKLDDIGFTVVKAINPTRPAFNATWQKVLDSLGKDDTFVLYFSAHGVQVEGQNYLLPRDIPYIELGRQAQLTREAISLNELLSDLTTGNRTHPKSSVVILDACRDNPLIPAEYKGPLSGGLANQSRSDGIFMIFSAASNSIALDRLSPNDSVKYSVFTRALLPLLGRQDLSIQDLSLELKKEVRRLAKSVNRYQRPDYFDGFDSEERFCFPGCAAKTNKDTAGPTENLVVSVRPATKNEITGKDGAPMVLIPDGEFLMGSPDSEGENDEHPRHKVALSAFYLDKYEVTNRFFQQFTQQTSYRTTAEREGKAWALPATAATGKPEEVSGAHWRNPEGGETVLDSNREEHPVVLVSWEDAQAYCRWAGKRLPTEAEFEYATRAGTETKYWWGNGNPGSRRVANIGDESLKRLYSDWPLPIMTGYDDGSVRTAPVGSFEANPFGLHDMTGNVWEWTSDRYDKQYYGNSPRKDPKGQSNGDFRVLRGGSWVNAPDEVRSANRTRHPPTYRLGPFGFRCAQDNPK